MHQPGLLVQTKPEGQLPSPTPQRVLPTPAASFNQVVTSPAPVIMTDQQLAQIFSMLRPQTSVTTWDAAVYLLKQTYGCRFPPHKYVELLKLAVRR